MAAIKILIALILMLWVIFVVMVCAIVMAAIREKLYRKSKKYGTISRTKHKRRRR